MAKANDIQIGGTHYQTSGAQHWDVCAELYGEAHFKCTATKYLMRWRDKNGLQDLQKAEHYLIKLKELLEEGYLVLVPSNRDFVRLTCVKMQAQDIEDWALMCRIFASENMEELDACIADIRKRMQNIQ